ncbi:MAG TPA: protein phosphatase 2C domain-containing protein [Chthoniobacterales bacterium]|nr:protein phosphatase 2C domain-containing protein [Chthoniobacterales bacterium]
MIQCPRCSASCPDESNYCEECGAALRQPASAVAIEEVTKVVSADPADLLSCPNCGIKLEAGTEFCPDCGIAPTYPDNFQIADWPDLVALCDRGIGHPKNEDAVIVKRKDSRSFLALSDGVSHSQRPELAAHRATSAAAAAFMESSYRLPKDLLREAVARAQAAVAEIPADPNLLEDPPCATLILALVSPNEIAVAWLGDSRAYFLTSECARLLTRDHSILVRLVNEAHVTASEALLLPGSHALTRAIGGGVAPEEPDIAIYPVTEPGLLLLCSDGLWNYVPESTTLYGVVRSHTLIPPPESDSLLPLAEALVKYACAQGGADNISVALTRIAPSNDQSPTTNQTIREAPSSS